MSGIENKVEEPVVAPEATTPAVVEPTVVAEATPTTTEPATTEAATETPAAAPATEEPSTETVEPTEAKEIAPISEGTLGYKAPGLLKSLRFSKKFFWLGDEAVEQKHLANYLRGEKPEVGNKNGAWALHTGKGLLFFSKTASEKTTPGGIINLAEISDVTNDGAVEFFFHYQSHKHSFQAASAAERDSWVAALSTAATEAKGNAEGITSSDAYKENLATLGRPVGVSPAAKKEEKKEEKAEDKEEKKEEKAAEVADKKEVKEEKKEEKADRKSRSQSRKRTSLFGGFNKKKEEPKTAESETAAPVETAATETTEPAPVEAVAAPTTETAPTETVEASEPTPAAAEPVKPATNKRTSIFGQLQSRFSNNKKEETAPAVPAKDEVAAPETSDAAPVIPVVETETPLSADINSPATVPTETTTPEVSEAAPTESTPKNEKRKSSLPFGFGGKNSPGLLSRFGTKKNKKSPSTEEPSTPVTSEKVSETAPVAEEPVAEIPATNGEAPKEPTPAAQTTPVVSATA